MAERLAVNHDVTGSSPVRGANCSDQNIVNAIKCRSAGIGRQASLRCLCLRGVWVRVPSPTPQRVNNARTQVTDIDATYAPVAQLVEQWAFNPCVSGSSPGWCTKSSHQYIQCEQQFLYNYFHFLNGLRNNYLHL